MNPLPGRTCKKIIGGVACSGTGFSCKVYDLQAQAHRPEIISGPDECLPDDKWNLPASYGGPGNTTGEFFPQMPNFGALLAAIFSSRQPLHDSR